jgi:hypothetical protein
MNLISKDDAGFVAEKGIYKLVFDFKTKPVIKLYRKGVEVTPNDRNMECVVGNHNGGFYGNASAFILLVSTENNRSMYEFAWDNFARQGQELTRKMGRCLGRLAMQPYLQILSLAGVHKSIYYELRYTCDKIATTPHEIMRLPKSIFNLIRYETVALSTAYKIAKELLPVFETDLTRTILTVIKEDSSYNDCYRLAADLSDLKCNSGYTDMARLLKYLLRDVKLNQGITRPSDAAQLLKDYIRMAGTIRHVPDRYPDSLKKVHDIMSMNYRIALDTRKEELFKNVVGNEEYKSLEFEAKRYCIVTPTTPKNLVEEGKDLGHCVASYVNDVLEGKCKILFLRYQHQPESSLVTVEVRGKNVRQIKGRLNRPPTPEEREFVNLWAEEKELEVASGY